MPLSISLPLVPGLILLNAFFVAAEYGLVAIRETQIASLHRRGRVRSAAAMARLKADPASAIGAIQVCITMTNLLLGWIGEPAMGRVLSLAFAPLLQYVPVGVFNVVAFGLSFLIVTLLTVVFSELLPKALTLRYVPAVATLTAVPVLGVLKLTRPLVWLMNAMANLVSRPLGLGRVEDMEKEWHTAEEIKLIAAEAAQQGTLTSQQGSLIVNTLSLGSRVARQIMVPRMRVVMLDVSRGMKSIRRTLRNHDFSRYPLCEGSLDKVIGVLHVKDLLMPTGLRDVEQLRELARKPVFIPDRLPLDKLLPAFTENKTEMLFLVDEYGGVEGIVTVRDFVEELVAEIRLQEAVQDAVEGAVESGTAAAVHEGQQGQDPGGASA